MSARKKVLVVNVFFDEYRRRNGSPTRIPRAMGHVFLAGAFDSARNAVRVYSEQHSGPLLDPDLLGWPDMLVLTGLTNGFDRMLHLTAYARALHPGVVVVAGGPAIRALPARAASVFDYALTTDVEGLGDAITDAFGPEYASEEWFPRFDLAEPSRLVGYVESSRNCNFHCSFCSLTAEGRRFQRYETGFLERQLVALEGRHIVLIDNNFFGNDRRRFEERLDLLGEFYRSGRIRSWAALVTGDFFAHQDYLERAKTAGCLSLFTGVESFDAATLRRTKKRQNEVAPQIEMIRNCLDAGILLEYGIMADPTTRPIAELESEIAYILRTPQITLPAYFTLAIPLLGTPYFQECLDERRILPNTRLHDLDGVVLSMKTIDPLEDAVAFARRLPSLAGHRKQVLRHAVGFTRRYARRLAPLQIAAALVNVALVATASSAASSPSTVFRRRPVQTFLSTTETLDPLYRPFMNLPSSFERYFKPTMITDADGEPSEDILPDLVAKASLAGREGTRPNA